MKKVNKKLRVFSALAGLIGVALFIYVGIQSGKASFLVPQVPIPGKNIPKYVDPLPHFAGARVVGTNLTVTMKEFQQKVLSSTFVYPAPFTAGTYVWGYEISDGINTSGPLYPGFTVEATRNTPTTMTYVNALPLLPFLQQYLTIDQTLHWADPLMQMPSFSPYSGPPPAVVHLHGGEVPSDFDGGPDQWFTSDGMYKGMAYRTLSTPPSANAAVYQYPNAQEPATLWFHDHTLGATRLNVYAGLAAFYFLRDWYDPAVNPNGLVRPDLPGGPLDTAVVDNSDPLNPRVIKPEIEIVIQDRMFDTNGQLYFPDIGLNPEHPFWIPEFLGDAIVVNGKTWPFLNVEPRRYRFRFLNGSNARFYRMWLENMLTATPGPVFWQIGTDGGLLDTPVKLDPNDPVLPLFLLLAPGERADIIIDFAGFAGQTLTLRNNARAPFPKGAPADPQTVGQIMQFRVGTILTGGADNSYNPSMLASPRKSPITNPPNPATATVKRQLTLNEVMGAGGPLEVLVNNSKWAGKRPDGTPIPGAEQDGQGNYLTELPAVGSTELWQIINLTADAHPIHLHLVQFKLVSRQNFNVNKYNKAYAASFPGGGIDPMTGLPYPPGVFMPAYGPPLNYFTGTPGFLGGNPDITKYLQGPAMPPELNEAGWKDTVIMYPGQVTTIVVRFSTQDGTAFSFDATGSVMIALDAVGTSALGPGYVWHCHIIDHEDNEMMRPYKVKN